MEAPMAPAPTTAIFFPIVRFTSSFDKLMQGYMGEKRKKLIAKFGYDTKNAAHLIRLLNMGIEALDEGTIHVARTHDREMLLDIKTGKWPLQDVKARAEDLFVIAEDAHNRSTVREEPLRDEVEDILESILADYLCHGVV